MTTEFNITIKFQYEPPDSECGDSGGWFITDIKDERGKTIDISQATCDELTELLINNQ
jgi:hypothetical protein